MKNDNEFESSGVMYKATAFAIFVILVVLIVLISVSYRKDNVNGRPDVNRAKGHDIRHAGYRPVRHNRVRHHSVRHHIGRNSRSGD